MSYKDLCTDRELCALSHVEVLMTSSLFVHFEMNKWGRVHSILDHPVYYYVRWHHNLHLFS